MLFWPMHDIAIFFQLLPPSCNFPSNYADLISVLWLLVAIVQSHYRISLIAAFNKSYERDYWETTLLLHLDLHFTSMDWGVKLTNKMWISIGKIPVFENVYICILKASSPLHAKILLNGADASSIFLEDLSFKSMKSLISDRTLGS